MSVYRQLIVKYGADIGDALRGAEKLNKSIDKNNKDIEKRFGALAGDLRSTGTALSIGVTAPLVLAGKAAIDADMRFDSLKRGLTAVMGSSSAATAEIDKLREVAKLPGLGFEEAQQGSLNLQAVGMSANAARETMLQFGNALATVGKGKNELNAVQEQIMQMVSKGKVMTEDIRIIRQYVPQLSGAMKAAFGTANAEQIGKMGVSGEEFVRRINIELAKLPRMTGGIRNDFENASDAMNQALARSGKAMEPFVSTALNGFTNAAKAFAALPAPVVATTVAIAGVAAATGPFLIALSYVPAAIGKVKVGAVLLRGAYETLALKCMYASEAIAAQGGVAAATSTSIRGLLASAKAFAVANPLLLAAAAAVAGILILKKVIDDTAASVDKMAATNSKTSKPIAAANKAHNDTVLSNASDANLQARLKTVNRQMIESEQKTDSLEPQTAWWKPGSASARYDWRMSQAETKRLDAERKAILAEIARRKNETANSPAAAAASLASGMQREADSWRLAGVKAEQAGNDAAASWAKINQDYYDKLADNAKQAASDKKFDKAQADMFALEEYRAEKAKYLREKHTAAVEKQKEEEEKRIEAVRQAAEDRKTKMSEEVSVWSELAQAQLEGQRLIAEAQGNLAGARQAEILSSAVTDIGSAAQAQIEGKDPRLVAQMLNNAGLRAQAESQKFRTEQDKDRREQAQAEELAGLRNNAAAYEKSGDWLAAAQTSAYADLITDMAPLNELMEKHIDVTERAAEAWAKYDKAIEDATKEHGQQLLDAVTQQREKEAELYNQRERERARQASWINPVDLFRNAISKSLSYTPKEVKAVSLDKQPATQQEIQAAQQLIAQEKTNTKLDQMILALNRMTRPLNSPA